MAPSLPPTRLTMGVTQFIFIDVVSVEEKKKKKHLRTRTLAPKPGQQTINKLLVGSEIYIALQGNLNSVGLSAGLGLSPYLVREEFLNYGARKIALSINLADCRYFSLYHPQNTLAVLPTCSAPCWSLQVTSSCLCSSY